MSFPPSWNALVAFEYESIAEENACSVLSKRRYISEQIQLFWMVRSNNNVFAETKFRDLAGQIRLLRLPLAAVMAAISGMIASRIGVATDMPTTKTSM